jgi:hypothetical protein
MIFLACEENHKESTQICGTDEQGCRTQGQHEENCDDKNQMERYSIYMTGRLKIVETSVLLNLIYRLNAKPIKISMSCLWINKVI